MTLPLSVEPPALDPVRCANPTCRRWLSDPVSVAERLGPECRGWRTRGRRRIAAPKRRASSPDQLDIFNINEADDMTIETTGRRRATDQEIAAARAWVEQYTADWIDGEDTERSRQEEYEHALELIVFANERHDPDAIPTAETAEATPGLTKVTLYLTPSAVEALGATVERTGETNTITINRAIQVYRHVLGLTVGERMIFEERDELVALLRVDLPDPNATMSPPSQPESGSLALEVPEEAPGTLDVAQGRRRAARLLRSVARNINGMHPEVAQQWLLSTADSFEKAAVEAAQQSAEGR